MWNLKYILGELQLWAYDNSDKLLHTLISCVLTIIFGWILPLFIVCPLVLIIGIVKELYDRKVSTWDNKDLIADIVGIILGVL